MPNFATITPHTASGPPLDWHSANQHYLMAAFGRVRAMVERHIARMTDGDAWRDARRDGIDADADAQADLLRDLGARMSAPPALEALVARFHLSPFERDLLLLAAGPELESGFAERCAAAQHDARRDYPTLSLALAALDEAHWSALTPSSPLRWWRMIDFGVESGPLLTRPLQVDERVLHLLAGAPHLDEQLFAFVKREPDAPNPAPSHRKLAKAVADTWTRRGPGETLPVIQLCGPERVGKRAVAAMACTMLGVNLYALPSDQIPTVPHERHLLMRLWEREAVLSGSALLLRHEAADGNDPVRRNAVRHFIDGLGTTLLVAGTERLQGQRRETVTFDVHKPDATEQRALWETALGTAAPLPDGRLDRLVSQFDLNPSAIRSISAKALGDLAAPRSDGDVATDGIETLLWTACRTQARPRLDDLARRITPVATWDDLILPALQRNTLHQIAAHVRQRATVHEKWGFAAKSARGLGISALFSGASGTGKTMAAEVLANTLRLDLYHIDLSQVVSKYIGETEKNLRRVFDAAEESGAILLFDEADALFGKRGEVKESHDRYANIEVSYLLQRMEAYRGLAVLTTNMKKALDAAFLRRLRFIVQFPFPDEGARADIWRRIFPAETPTEGLDAEKLARLNVAGGNIRNIAMNAAFLAADSGEPVRMAHLLDAARSEYAKLEKSLTSVEVAGWI